MLFSLALLRAAVPLRCIATHQSSPSVSPPAIPPCNGTPRQPCCASIWRQVHEVAFSVAPDFTGSHRRYDMRLYSIEIGRGEGGSSVGGGDDPRRHVKTYSIKGTGVGAASTTTTDTGHELRTDVPRKMGGDDAAPQPVEHLLAALVGCTEATALYVGRSMRPRPVLVERMEFDLRAERDERGALQRPIDVAPSIPARLTSVSGIVRVHARNGATLTLEELRLLAEQTEARCPVANMILASGCTMDVEWVDGSDECTSVKPKTDVMV